MVTPLYDRRYAVDVLAVLFGIGSWVAVNGLYVEFPLLVERLPEGWNLPSYLSVAIQMANIGPILYGFLHRFFPRSVHETSATFLMMIVGVVACILLIFIWDITAKIGGKDHSVALIAIVFFVAIVDCTSSVVFFPFMGFFKEKYLISLFVGEGLSGLLPGFVSLAQGIGRTSQCENVTIGNGSSYMTVMVTSAPLFGLEVFFGFLSVMMVVSFAAFVLLRFLPSMTTERSFVIKNARHLDNTKTGSISESCSQRRLNYGTDSVSEDVETEEITNLTTSTFVYLFIAQGWISFLGNGVLPSISSYYCLPYGSLTYRLATSFSSVINPLICFASYFLATRKTSVISLTTFVGTLFALYLFILAAYSPRPPFVGTTAGKVLVVLASIGFSGTISYTKTSIATAFRSRSRNVRALFWYGVATQLGSSVGAVLMFVAVNCYDAFKSYNPCQ